ncbi:hypothetical protein [Deinococcus puniceus]|uniref:Uncharacterized protein n=1 Tax=Deinococcus puniceus TaxID=1182568 RepID=A0A172TC21_9DEIO|nr:hypothetical protein [Deinococcus puniceus]ANE44560.1 hypothetical protein SU48_13210 [Deinococcus puniceus]
MSLPLSPAPNEFPSYRMAEFLPAFLLGWGIGAALVFGVRALGGALLTDPCQGHTLLALIMPLVLGPGGLGFTAFNFRRPKRAALGLGLVVASLMPALSVGARDIGALRGSGCAGGYVVLSASGGPTDRSSSISTLSLRVGESRTLSGRVGGYTPSTHPGLFTLAADSNTPGITVQLPKTQVRAGEVFPVTVSVKAGTGVNSYTVGVQARQIVDGKSVAAVGTLEVNARP